MKYRVTNVPHVVPVERTWQDERVVHSLSPNVPEFIGHAVHVLLDNSHKICLSLNRMWSRTSDSEVPVHSIDPTDKNCSLVFMVCRSRDAMNCVLNALANLAATKSDKLLLSLR